MAKFTLFIPDMMCSHCEQRIRDAVSGTGTVDLLDLQARKVVVDTPLPQEDLLALISDAGYEAQVLLSE